VYAVPLRSTHIANATSHTRERYMKYAFLFTANALHFSIMNKFYFYFFRGGYMVFSPLRYEKQFNKIL